MGERNTAEAADIVLEAVDAMPSGFADLLFARTAAEDLAPLGPQVRSALAVQAWEHLHHRRGRGPDIRIAELAADGAGGPPRTVVEIVNDDRPFLLDSTVEEVTAQGFEIRLIAHPVLALARDGQGRLVEWHGRAGRTLPAGSHGESLIHLHVTTPDRAPALQALDAGLRATYRDVAAATGDWQAMRQRLREAIRRLADDPPPLPAAEIAEAIAFLRWLDADNFTFLGMRDYAHRADAAGERLDPIAETGLGILRDPELRMLRRGNDLATFTPEVRAFLHQPVPLVVTKASIRSRVHRRAYLDYVGLKLFDADGGLAGEMRLVGLFTHTAYTHSVADIPLVRRKAAELFERLGFQRNESSGRALVRLLESYPRDDLFQIDGDTLLGFAGEILSLYERPRIRVLARIDRFDRFVSLIVFIPRERYDSPLADRIAQTLAEAYGGHVSAIYPAFPEGVPLTRLHIIVGRRGGTTPRPERAVLERAIARLVQAWPDRLRAILTQRHGMQRARRLAARYAGAFDQGYRDAFSPEDAAADIVRLERLGPDRPLAADFAPRPDHPREIALKLVAHGRELPLAERVPMLERMGLRAIDERTFRITPGENGDRTTVWLHDMVLEEAAGAPALDAAAGTRLEELFLAVVDGRAESDGLNRLTLLAGLGWRDVTVLRAVSRYLRQALIPFGQDYMAEVLGRHPKIAAAVVGLFRLRFDPEAFADMAAREKAAGAAVAAIESDLDSVESLDEDRILRRFLGVVRAMTRTNFFQRGLDGAPPAALAFKVRSAEIDGLPAPRPLFDLFVHSPRFEGIHLRFGRVARGGIRWSDRPQDFRTEILGLVKAQQVKNAVIVPVGAKGGFVPLKLPEGPREAVFAEGTAVYRQFIATLLDLTDDLDGGEVVPPRAMVRYDGDDPYLVVAADKGTATFSDTANAIAAEHGFWLDDAFASGGSEGYDHKAMGITARGAWESVKRHFREKGVDVQTTPFTVAGVGDMSGDVFGNGMLMSREIRLVAAFDHRDIFLDPAPDPAVAFAERERMFKLPRSSWADYDRSRISAGGGVFPRSAKTVPLSGAARALLGLAADAPTPQEVMTAILRLDVDLLWFGGIGTFIRASTETNADAGDRANDAIRIVAAEIGAEVIGEGANLGMTQRGRIEAARRGIALNTDAIDNSAGVNTSDMEVNIKIALAGPVRDGTLPRAERNALLHGMTDEVAALVLRNNYEQTLALSLAARRGVEDLGFEVRLMQALEAEGRLDRAVEFLPDEAALGARRAGGEGLTRPELAVLLAYAKAALFDGLLESDAPDDPYFDRLLTAYFPAPMQERFRGAIEGHRLRREIVATQLANLMINRGGPSLVARLGNRAGVAGGAIAGAFALAHDSFRLGELNAAIDAIDGRIDGTLQLRLYGAAQELLLSRMAWFLRHRETGAPLASAVARFRDGIDKVRDGLDRALGDAAQAALAEAAASLIAEDVPAALARQVAALSALRGAPDAVLVAEAAACPLADAAATLFAIADGLGLDALRARAATLAAADDYERLALDRALDQVEATGRALATAAARAGRFGASAGAWLAERPDAAEARRGIDRIAASGLTLAKLSVAAGLLADLAAA
ncbi:MAG TPA: NAD-glutamate dehydrogenase [Hyphomicrobiales bacterium]|nr:NAD-glutamate dehydrogenase [Hyphomicrobiales bacterium]